MCRHNKKFSIQEIMWAVHERFAENGIAADVEDGRVIGYNDIGDISHYEFICECGKRLKFKTTSATKPAYLVNAINILYPIQN